MTPLVHPYYTINTITPYYTPITLLHPYYTITPYSTPITLLNPYYALITLLHPYYTTTPYYTAITLLHPITPLLHYYTITPLLAIRVCPYWPSKSTYQIWVGYHIGNQSYSCLKPNQ